MKRFFLFFISLTLAFSLTTPPVSAQDIDGPNPAEAELAEHVPGELLVRFSPGMNSAQAADKMNEMGVTHKREIQGINVHLVLLPPGLSVEQAIVSAACPEWILPSRTISCILPKLPRRKSLINGD